MANEKLREEKYIISEEASFVRHKILKYCKEDCFSLTPEQIDTVINLYKEYDEQPKPPRTGPNVKQSVSVGGFHVDIDCSEALTGLKAVQREARKATAALKELEAQQDKMAYLPIRPEVSE